REDLGQRMASCGSVRETRTCFRPLMRREGLCLETQRLEPRQDPGSPLWPGCRFAARLADGLRQPDGGHFEALPAGLDRPHGWHPDVGHVARCAPRELRRLLREMTGKRFGAHGV